MDTRQLRLSTEYLTNLSNVGGDGQRGWGAGLRRFHARTSRSQRRRACPRSGRHRPAPRVPSGGGGGSGPGRLRTAAAAAAAAAGRHRVGVGPRRAAFDGGGRRGRVGARGARGRGGRDTARLTSPRSAHENMRPEWGDTIMDSSTSCLQSGAEHWVRLPSLGTKLK